MSPQEVLRRFHARFDPVCHGQPTLVDDRLAGFRLELFEGGCFPVYWSAK